MRGSRKLTAAAAAAVSLLAFTALGSALPQEKPSAEDSGRSCCARAVDVVRSDARDQPADRAVLLALAGQDANQPATKKHERKASPETMAKGVATRKALLEQVTAMVKDGVADCCIGPGCALCVIAADACGCAASLEKGGPVCPECWGGWQAGQGMVPDVNPDKVQILPKATLQKIYGMKADKLEEAGAK